MMARRAPGSPNHHDDPFRGRRRGVVGQCTVGRHAVIGTEHTVQPDTVKPATAITATANRTIHQRGSALRPSAARRALIRARRSDISARRWCGAPGNCRMGKSLRCTDSMMKSRSNTAGISPG